MKNLYQGDRGILVSYMQLALKRAGYPLLVDGIFGTNTCRALADFLQTDRTPDRICVVDRSAWEKLLPYLRGYTTEEGENRILFEDPVTSVEVPYTSLLTAAVIDGILARYPFLKSGEIGKSVMGKPISYLEIGNGDSTTHLFMQMRASQRRFCSNLRRNMHRRTKKERRSTACRRRNCLRSTGFSLCPSSIPTGWIW